MSYALCKLIPFIYISFWYCIYQALDKNVLLYDLLGFPIEQ